MDNIIARLKEVDEAALFIIREVLEARSNSCTAKLRQLDLNSDLCKGYALLSALADAVLAEREQIKQAGIVDYKAMLPSGLSHE